jgi:hypothetical protein
MLAKQVVLQVLAMATTMLSSTANTS